MPTTQNDFLAYSTALLLKNIEDLKKILQNFDFTATDDDGRNCLMLCAMWSKSTEVVKVILEKIEQTGGPDLLKSLLAATNRYGRNCLMLCSEYSSSPEVVKLIFEKIETTCGPDLLKSQLTAIDNDGQNCLMLCCSTSSSPEVVKLIFEKIETTCGPDLLKSLLTATNKYGSNCLMLCGFLNSPEVMKLFAAVLFHVDLFKIQYAKLSDYGKKALKKKAGIDSSWVPDAASLAEVKAILQGADPHAAKKKVEQEAATKKKIEEEAAAKKKPEEEAAAKKKAEEEAAAKKKAEEEAAAKKKAEEEAAAKKKAEEEAALAKKKAEEEAALAKKKAEEEAAKKAQSQQQSQDQTTIDVAITTDSAPPTNCFKRGVPPKNLEDSINALMSIKEAPEHRPDLADWIPDKNDCDSLLHYLNTALKELKERPAIKKLMDENGLTPDDIKILHSYKIEVPYPIYRWLNGWLGGDRRDDFVKQNVAPFFTLLYRAMEKLPKITTTAYRGIKLNDIPALQATYDNYEKACAPGKNLSFWGFSSFSTKDDVVTRKEFIGDSGSIIYSCESLIGVDMEPFAPKGLKNESEILPLCPCVLEVKSAVKFGKKLIVGVKQLNHAKYSYVVPK